MNYTREWIASYPAKAVVGQITASHPRALSFTAQWNRTGLDDGTRNGTMALVAENGCIILAGFSSGAPNYAGMFSIYSMGGKQHRPATRSRRYIINAVADIPRNRLHIQQERHHHRHRRRQRPHSHRRRDGLVEHRQLHGSAPEACGVASWRGDKVEVLQSTRDSSADFRQFFDRAALYVDPPATNTSLDLNGRFQAYINGAQNRALETLMWAFGCYMMILILAQGRCHQTSSGCETTTIILAGAESSPPTSTSR